MEEVDKLVSDYVSKYFPRGSEPLSPLASPRSRSPTDHAAFGRTAASAPALLAGNSVHADRAFINKDLPLLASKLHYRILDVSSIKEIGRRWYPSLGWQSKKDEAEHRCVKAERRVSACRRG